MKSLFPISQAWMAIVDYLRSLIGNKIDIYMDNTATGTNTVTINEKSGTATYTNSIGGNTVSPFTILNDLVTTSTVIIPTLKYSPIINNGRPEIKSWIASAGSLTIFVENSSGTATNGNIIVPFIIIS